MKRASQFKILIMFMLLPLFLVAENTIDKGEYTKKKKINKEFPVSTNTLLSVNNNYGNLDIVTWNENRIVFEITIITTGNNEEKVQEKLNNITVDFETSTNHVSAKTKFSTESKSWWDWTNNNKVSMKINYIIKIPITNSIDLNNNYGNINLDKLEGQAKIKCDYGKITTKELMASNNILRFDYSNNCYFEYIKGGIINADYSSFLVSKTNSLNIEADYTKSEVEIAEDIIYKCDYGSLKVQKTNSINGNGDYLSLKLGDVYKAISIKADYGSIKIEKLHRSFKNLFIKSNYSGIKIGYDTSLNFGFDLNTEYASINGSNDFDFTKKAQKSNKKHYLGHHGSPNSGSKININSEYGGITFYKN